MITCKKNDRLLELLWFVGYSIEFPTQLAVRIGGGAEWNRRVMYRAIQEGYVRLYRKQYKRHVIRSMSLTQKGYEYIAQRIKYCGSTPSRSEPSCLMLQGRSFRFLKSPLSCHLLSV